MDERVTISGTVEDVTFRNDATGFAVLELDAGGEPVTCVGDLADVEPGESVTMTGVYVTHPSFGRQFKADSCLRRLPETADRIYKYLASGVVHGVGPKTAMNIVETFGDDTLAVLEQTPEKLAVIRGISPERAQQIGAEFRSQNALRTVILSLQQFGLTAAECMRVYRKVGLRAADVIKENPYRLCDLDVGIGFERAEQIAQTLVTKPAADFRTGAGVVHVLRHNSYANGHTCLPRDKVVKTAAEFLNTPPDDVDIAIDSFAAQGQLRAAELDGREFLFLPDVYQAEKRIAERIALCAGFPPPPSPSLPDQIDAIERKNGITYETEQRRAIVTAAKKGLLILTGGPGTGKTTTIRGILDVFEKQGLSIALAAPTGRAAKRMAEVTGREAKTIHRLLECSVDKDGRFTFVHNVENPLPCDALILDEVSMVDVSVFASLMAALPLGCRLVLVGDSNQLPSVGPGNVLHDIIDSGVLPVVCLTQVFRQAQKSKIVTNAHRIVAGEAPDLANASDTDFFHLERPDAATAAETVTELVTLRLPKTYGWNPMTDIQVISPTRQGPLGTHELNRRLQAVLNPPDRKKVEFKTPRLLFREGDKVMQIRNNYDILWKSEYEEGTGVFNGDIGVLERIDLHEATFLINFDGRKAVIPSENSEDLELAYAVTVHKSQGNEFKAVVLPALRVPQPLAYRNLLYTGITRARELLVTVGTARQIEAMAANDRETRRYSALAAFLKAAF